MPFGGQDSGWMPISSMGNPFKPLGLQVEASSRKKKPVQTPSPKHLVTTTSLSCILSDTFKHTIHRYYGCLSTATTFGSEAIIDSRGMRRKKKKRSAFFFFARRSRPKTHFFLSEIGTQKESIHL